MPSLTQQRYSRLGDRLMHDGGNGELPTMRPEPTVGAVEGGYKLIVLGAAEPVSHRLPSTGTVTIGRSEAATVQVADPLISRVHAAIELAPRIGRDDVLRVVDLGSSNGTVVRGKKLQPDLPTTVSIGEAIDFGSTVVIVQRALAMPSSAPSAEAEDGDAPPQPYHRGSSDAMKQLHKLVQRIASSRINVLLQGETGAGKEVMAQTIHRLSPRVGQAFLGINCAAVSEALFESELFGHERGAFTGATHAKAGLIESADKGTVFLDEIAEMPLAAQAKLLRVLEERAVFRVGSLRQTPADVRFVTATNRDLRAEVAAGRFREDLYYRLNGISLVVPPLRERRDEVVPLARTFLTQACREAGFEALPVFSADALRFIVEYDWPGNVRELKNAVHRAVLLAADGVIEPEHLVPRINYSPRSATTAAATAPGSAPASGSTAAAPEPQPPGDSTERGRIIEALAHCGGNQTRAAERLGISRRTLSTRLNAFGIPRPRKKG